jgi:hypothetical protein
MACERVRNWLAEGEGDTESLSSPPVEFARHLADCEQCAAAWSEERAESERLDRFLAQSVPAWRASVPRVALTESVLARLAEPEAITDGRSPDVANASPTSRRTTVWGLRSTWVALSGLAALVAVVSLLPSSAPRAVHVVESRGLPTQGVIATEATGPTRVANVPPSTAPVDGTEASGEPFPLSHLLVDANAAWADLAEETAETVGDVVALSRPVMPGRVESGNSSGSSIRAAVDAGAVAVPVDWIPLRKQVGGALEFLRESLREEDNQGSRSG